MQQVHYKLSHTFTNSFLWTMKKKVMKDTFSGDHLKKKTTSWHVISCTIYNRSKALKCKNVVPQSISLEVLVKLIIAQRSTVSIKRFYSGLKELNVDSLVEKKKSEWDSVCDIVPKLNHETTFLVKDCANFVSLKVVYR